MTAPDTDSDLARIDADPCCSVSSTGSFLDAEPTGDDQ